MITVQGFVDVIAQIVSTYWQNSSPFAPELMAQLSNTLSVDAIHIRLRWTVTFSIYAYAFWLSAAFVALPDTGFLLKTSVFS